MGLSGRLATMPGNLSQITALTFNHEEDLLASASFDDMIRVYNSYSGS